MSDQPIDEITQLRQRVAELERQNRSYQHVIDALPMRIFWKDRDGRYLGCNRHLAADAGRATTAELIGLTDYDMPWGATEAELYRADDRAVIERGEPRLKLIEPQQTPSGAQIWLETNKVPLRDGDDTYAVLGTYEDVTKRQEEEEERLREQQSIIDAQASILAELSTPLIPLREGVLLLPLVGAIDSRRALQVLETLLEGISAHQAEIAILDITGVRVVDTQVADGLLRAARAAKLLGANVYLSGISAEIAQTLVQLGTDLNQIVTFGSLQNAVAQAFE
jgi:rsbT co-antagonist protein RsbR